ncbi:MULTISPECIES: class I SAM-dependent DNA methyltransferase [unclassified Pseudomonas]|uniref:HsdM family class I SAM-dependent methyltransferase n=1 Tax=unclassified Pseudomonas TaxID=196821 RepID=UPI000BD7CEA2|nr:MULTISPECIES: N-6 DNA methylase [unclassified Pseudomonas]PVZ12620.1 adenine-specific DNA-methyltransferase [Pseudomonas sp. URIL14HWK12:I12]PVZ23229.1 adenine-specific DNA-methyltransferase [Pseudomonas sp. URIL14HWK12:I10]PVZ32558.1 adenine-specific DNA-methyltransferase [Pseudomonas sp. URIL14HWK12:I11]SNZ13664.1 adenine-specific DNA-methyltransferase [Pseudomonas sp. URIL14HWK12:I9]
MNSHFLEEIEKSRVATTNSIAIEKKKLSEQYFTPAKVSLVMANMFTARTDIELSVLDPCCGVGNLSAAVLDRAEREKENISLTLIEKDAYLIDIAKNNFREIQNVYFCEGDFFEHAETLKKFDRIIINPPYSKISSKSDFAKKCFRALGYKEANLYSAFISYGLKLLSTEGELVAIIPRSFCNGPSFREFRKRILEDFHVQEIYLFESRAVFCDSNVLQELLILKIVRQGDGRVKISHEKKSGEVNTRYTTNDKVFFSADFQKFIHIPMAVGDDELLEKMSRFNHTMLSIGLRASTGKVVDFRCGNWLRTTKTKETSHLLYQDNVKPNHYITFDRTSNDKSGYIAVCDDSLPVLIPNRNYILVRRISFKESQTRIVAGPLLSNSYTDSYIGIENHLNYIWGEKTELTQNICIALFAYISTRTIDLYIRRFSGHTQINATDLNSIPIPGVEKLETFGRLHSKFKIEEIVKKAEDAFFPDKL